MRVIGGLVALALVAGACGGNSADQEAATGPSAVEVGGALRAGGVVLDAPSDTTSVLSEDERKAGLRSQAKSATDVAGHPIDVSIEVYRSAEDRNQARLQLVRRIGGEGLRLAECDRILVTFVTAVTPEPPPLAQGLKQRREQAGAVLMQRYGPC